MFAGASSGCSDSLGQIFPFIDHRGVSSFEGLSLSRHMLHPSHCFQRIRKPPTCAQNLTNRQDQAKDRQDRESAKRPQTATFKETRTGSTSVRRESEGVST